MQKQVYTQGLSPDITVPAAGYLAVWAKGEANVFQKKGYPNQPNSIAQIGTLNGQNVADSPVAFTLFGPYASGGTFAIENVSGQVVFYDVGLAPVLSNMLAEIQTTPGVLNATGALTGAMIAAGLVTSTTGAAVVATLPTGAVMETNGQFNVNDCFDWSAINTGANAFTVTAAASGHTVVGAGAVAAGTSGRFRTRKTAASTFVTYRIG